MCEWVDIKDYEGLYQINSNGQIRTMKTNIIRRNQTNTLGYSVICLCKNNIKKTVFLHRILFEAYNGKIDEGFEVDHIDGNLKNNDLNNLRLATRLQNCRNTKIPNVKKTSKYKGVFSQGFKWIAQIKINRRSTHIGTFKIEKDAAEAYGERALEVFGEFALTNKMIGLL